MPWLITMLSVCVIISVSFGLTLTSPVYNNPFYSNYGNVDYDNMVRVARNLMPKPVPESWFLRPLEANINSNDANTYSDTPSIIRLPTSGDLTVLDPLPQTSYFEHGIRAALPLEYELMNQKFSSPEWNNDYLRTSYETDMTNAQAYQGLNRGSMNTDVDPYEVDLYPMVHTSLSAALNPMPPANDVAPVLETEILETMPSLTTRGGYDIDVLNPENSGMMMPNSRLKRNFLQDLTHEAMMQNLLPTMPVPFTRGAEISPVYYSGSPQSASLGEGAAMAIYPKSAVNTGAIPLLLRCSPNVVRGSLSNGYAEPSPQVAGVAYRENSKSPAKEYAPHKV